MNGKERDKMNVEIRSMIKEYELALKNGAKAPEKIDDLGDKATILFCKLSHTPIDYQDSCKYRIALIARLATELREI